MITNEHITLINTTFAQYNVNLVAKYASNNNNISFAEDSNNNLLLDDYSHRGDLTLQMILNNTFIELDLPRTFDKETLLNKVKEVLESKANGLQRGLDNINTLRKEVNNV